MSSYITSTGSYLPGPPIDNEQIEARLGLVEGKPSRLKRRILAANGIRTRYYALDEHQRTTHQNEDLAYHAGARCLQSSPLEPAHIGMLSCASSQGDLVLPGFASMVQARLGVPEVELHTAHGICSSSVMALKVAHQALVTEEHRAAMVVCSELASRLLKASRFEAAGGHAAVDFQAEFLRWMLSDGAGAALLEARPRGLCLRIDWIRSFSHADSFPVCMSVGQARVHQTRSAGEYASWQEFPTYAQAEAAGALLIRQDMRLLEHIVKLGVDGALRLVEEGYLRMSEVDHFLCHYSSHHFRGKIVSMLEMAGAMIPEDKWYTNLYDEGNTGSASILIMLDRFVRERRAKPGEKVLCMVPESGRFNVAYMHLTVVD